MKKTYKTTDLTKAWFECIYTNEKIEEYTIKWVKGTKISNRTLHFVSFLTSIFVVLLLFIAFFTNAFLEKFNINQIIIAIISCLLLLIGTILFSALLLILIVYHRNKDFWKAASIWKKDWLPAATFIKTFDDYIKSGEAEILEEYLKILDADAFYKRMFSGKNLFYNGIVLSFRNETENDL